MIVLGRVKGLERLERGDDRSRKQLRLVEFGDVALRDLLLLVVGDEDRRAVLRALVRPLVVQLGRIVGDGEDRPAATGRRSPSMGRR